MQKFGVEFKVNEWRLFIDSSKRSLKAVLLNNGNNYASLPIGNSVHLTESCDNLELILTTIGYTADERMICGYLKVLCVLLVSRLVIPRTHVSCVNGTAQQEVKKQEAKTLNTEDIS
jgi:hypothetical protein